MASPMPEPDPVTTAVFPERSNMVAHASRDSGWYIGRSRNNDVGAGVIDLNLVR